MLTELRVRAIVFREAGGCAGNDGWIGGCGARGEEGLERVDADGEGA